MAANRIYLQVDLSSDSAQANINSLNKAIAETGPVSEKASSQATGALNKVSVSVKSTSDSFSEMGAALAGLGIERLASSLVKLGSDFSRIQVAMETFTGSAAEAQQLLADIKGVADRGIFDYKDLAQAGQRMKAFGIETKNVAPYLEVLQNQVAAIGGSMDELNGLVSIFGRIMEKESVGAMDLLRKLPQSAAPVMAALKKQIADALKVDPSTIGSEDVKKAIANGLLPDKKTINTVVVAMDEFNKRVGEKMQDASQAFKVLSNNIRLAGAALEKSFDPALVQFANHLGVLLVPLNKFIEFLNGLSDNTKEWILWIGAAGTGIIALATAFKFLTSVLGPGYQVLQATFTLFTTFMAANPQLLLAIGAIAGAFVLLYTTVPQVKQFVDKGVESMTAKFKSMFAEVKKGAADLPKDTSPGLQEGSEIARKQSDLIAKMQDEAAQKLMQAYASPMEEITIHYATLLRELNAQIKEGYITPAHAANLMAGFDAAKTTEINAQMVKDRKQAVDEWASYATEKVKGETDAVVAYIEAQDAQDLRRKVAAIDRITQLRIDAEDQVRLIQKARLQEQVTALDAFQTANKQALIDSGISEADQAMALARLQEQVNAKGKLADQKAVDEMQKYQLEGWKKSNDAIIEDQKRVFDAFRDMWGEFFDAMTGKAGNVGKAIGDMFKKMAIGELKETFASGMAGLTTQAAGYGRPQESMPQHGQGLIGLLIRRGMPPVPQQFGMPGVGGVPALPEMNTAFAGFPGAGGASDVPLMNKVKMYDISEEEKRKEAAADFQKGVADFQKAVDQMGAQNAQTATATAAVLAPVATDTQKAILSAAASAPTGNPLNVPAEYRPMFARASAATGLPQAYIESIAKAESGFNPKAGSTAGALGIMQLMESTAKQVGVSNRLDPEQSIMGGAKYLEQQYKRFGSFDLAAAAYNAGPGAVLKYGGIPPYKETQAYVPRVMGYLGQYGSPSTEAVSSSFITDAGTTTFPQTAIVNPAQMAGLPAGGSVVIAAANTYAAAAPEVQTVSAMGGGVAAAAVPGRGLMQNIGLPDLSSFTMTPDSYGATPRISPAMFPSGDTNRAQGLLGMMLGGLTKAGGPSGGMGGIGGLGKLVNMANVQAFFGIGQHGGPAAGGGILQQLGLPNAVLPGMGNTTFKSVATSPFVGALATAGGMSLASFGYQRRNATATSLGGGLAGAGMMMSNPTFMASLASKMGGGAGGTAGALGAGIATGAGAGLVMSGLQKGGWGGFGMDVAGGALAGAGIGTMIMPGLGTAIGAAVGAAAGAIAGGIRMLIHTESEKIRIQIKQVYGIDISNVQLLTQIKQIIDQTYGGNVAVGIRSQQVQDIVRLYALSTGQSAGLPRPMYNATFTQSAATGTQLQNVYQGGIQVQNPYSGPTTYQYQQAVTTSEGLKAGTSLGVPGATDIVNSSWPTVVAAIQSNPSAVARSSAAAARAGDSRMSTSSAMLEPLTALS